MKNDDYGYIVESINDTIQKYYINYYIEGYFFSYITNGNEHIIEFNDMRVWSSIDNDIYDNLEELVSYLKKNIFDKLDTMKKIAEML